MAIIPLFAATDGLLNTVDTTNNTVPVLGIASRGLLYSLDTVTPPVTPPEIPISGPKGGFTYSKFKKRHEIDKYDFIKMEDDEILIIIKAFMQCQ